MRGIWTTIACAGRRTISPDPGAVLLSMVRHIRSNTGTSGEFPRSRDHAQRYRVETVEPVLSRPEHRPARPTKPETDYLARLRGRRALDPQVSSYQPPQLSLGRRALRSVLRFVHAAGEAKRLAFGGEWIVAVDEDRR